MKERRKQMAMEEFNIENEERSIHSQLGTILHDIPVKKARLAGTQDPYLIDDDLLDPSQDQELQKLIEADRSRAVLNPIEVPKVKPQTKVNFVLFFKDASLSSLFLFRSIFVQGHIVS